MPTSKRKDPQNNAPNQPPYKKLKDTHVPDGEFQVVKANLSLSVPPVFAANPRAGVEEMLDSMIMRYIPSLQGVVLSHSNLVFTNKEAVIQRDCPFLICQVAFDATVWSPRVGLKLCKSLIKFTIAMIVMPSSVAGKVNLCSPDHISLLVHRTFNVSIPRNHIPADTWEFEYGPAENDPEFEAMTTGDEAQPETEAEKEQGTSGKWMHKLTGENLGKITGFLEFTVIGLTVANEMLSLLGSLQPDPFSPYHSVNQQHETRKESSDSSEDEDEDDDSSEDSGSSEAEAENDSYDSEMEMDTFQMLGKRKDIEDMKSKGVLGKKKQG